MDFKTFAERLVQCAKQFEFRGMFKDTTINVIYCDKTDYLKVVLESRNVPCSISGELKSFYSRCDVDETHLQVYYNKPAEYLYSQIYNSFVHEVNEGIWYRGKVINDPHWDENKDHDTPSGINRVHSVYDYRNWVFAEERSDCYHAKTEIDHIILGARKELASYYETRSLGREELVAESVTEVV